MRFLLTYLLVLQRKITMPYNYYNWVRHFKRPVRYEIIYTLVHNTSYRFGQYRLIRVNKQSVQTRAGNKYKIQITLTTVNVSK